MVAAKIGERRWGGERVACRLSGGIREENWVLAFGDWEARHEESGIRDDAELRYRYTRGTGWKGGVGAAGEREVPRLASAECF